MTKPLDLSIVVPVYNNSNTLRKLYENIYQVFEKTDYDWEILFINDGSADNSWEILTAMRQANSRIKLINLSKNFGQHNATICGLKFSNGEYIVTMDADLQNKAEDIPRMIEKLKQGYDVIYGLYEEKQHSRIRNFFSDLVYKISQKAMGIKNNLSSFRVIKRSIVESVVETSHYDIIIDTAIGWITNNITYIIVDHEKAEKSNYGLVKLIEIGVNFIFNFTIWPLRFASVIGFAFSSLAFLLIIYFFTQKIFGITDVSGFTAIIISILFFSGVLLIFLGIIGEYVARIYLKSHSKPQYCVKERTGFHDE